MKLIAAKDFYNTKALGLKVDTKDPLHLHADHVHKGARIIIGTAEHYKDLGPADQEAVGTLLKRGLVVLDNKENAENGVIESILTEAKQENAFYKRSLEKPKSTEELVAAAVTKALAEVAKK